MKLEVIRRHYSQKSTISDLYVDGYLYSQILEDVVRAADAPKVFGKTAIPAGTYKVIINMSGKFKRLLPLLLNVKGGTIQFGDRNIDECGVRIHTGNAPENTEGCLIVGEYNPATTDWVANSRNLFEPLFKKMLYKFNSKEPITLVITDTQTPVVVAPAPKSPEKAPKKK